MNRILFSHAALDSSSLNVINTTLCINEILKIIGSIFLIIFSVVMVVFIIYVIRDILSKVKEEREEREKNVIEELIKKKQEMQEIRVKVRTGDTTTEEKVRNSLGFCLWVAFTFNPLLLGSSCRTLAGARNRLGDTFFCCSDLNMSPGLLSPGWRWFFSKSR